MSAQLGDHWIVKLTGSWSVGCDITKGSHDSMTMILIKAKF